MMIVVADVVSFDGGDGNGSGYLISGNAPATNVRGSLDFTYNMLYRKSRIRRISCGFSVEIACGICYSD